VKRRVPCYQVDAFAERLFEGNPAAVCVLAQWLPDDVMQQVAAEHNLSETAFLVPAQDRYQLRWMTPVAEVDLCGHATLAAAFVVMTELRPTATRVRFQTRSGELSVERDGARFWLDLPARPPRAIEEPRFLTLGLGAQPEGVYEAEHVVMAVFRDEHDVASIRPDFSVLARIRDRSVIVTAPGREVDFVSRFFAPGLGVDEDPVTGSAHCTLTPYWAKRLRKRRLDARQISRRGGALQCEALGRRVRLGGCAVLYSKGEAALPA
jgi:predicted PhzF superfamily epimerase YddE/YHI9